MHHNKKTNILKIDFTTKKIKSGFSLLELAVILLIVGFITGSISVASGLINSTRLVSARSMSKNAPVLFTKGLRLWLDATNIDAFVDGATNNGGLIEQWQDSNPKVNYKIFLESVAQANAPTYDSNAINSLPALLFDGTDDYLDSAQFDLASDEMTIVIVAQRQDQQSNNELGYLSMWQDALSDDGNSNNAIAIRDGSLASTDLAHTRNLVSNVGVHPGNRIPYIFVLVFDGTNTYSYLNGSGDNFTNPTAVDSGFNFNNIRLGARLISSVPNYFWNGHIGEVMIFDRAISLKQRVDIEEYLSKKWKIDLDLS